MAEPWNIPCMFVTWPTCHAERSLVKLLAPVNIRYMLVTCPTCHAERSLEKLLAWKNMLVMSVTCPTCHADRSPEKVGVGGEPANMFVVLVTPLVSHVETAPYVCCDSGQLKSEPCALHSATAVAMVESSIT